MSPNTARDRVHPAALTKTNVALAGLLSVANLTYHEFPVSDHLPFDSLVQRGAERIGAEHADFDRLVGALERLRRPFHEFGEVEKKRRLYLILVNLGAPQHGRAT